MRIIKKIIIAIIVLGLLIGIAWEYYGKTLWEDSGVDELKNYVVQNTYVKAPKNSVQELLELLEKIEYYQPLYNIKFPAIYDFFNHVKREDTSKNRAETVYSYLKEDMKFKKLHILDVGSNLGYMSLFMGDHGGAVLGLDTNLDHIKIARILGKLNNLTDVAFELEEFNPEYISKMDNSYDVAFIFSVLHHVTLIHGLEYTQDLMVNLLDKVPLLFVELAIAEEKVNFPWRAALPEDPLAVFAKCKNCEIEKIGEFDTHLSNIKRPLYVVKKKVSI